MSTVKVKEFATLVVVGTWLLLALSACEQSKRAEIVSTEEVLRARPEMATVPDAATETESATQTESDQGGLPFEGQSIARESPGLSESLVFSPEPPPGPVLPSGDEGGVAAGTDVTALVPPSHPPGYSAPPLVERSPASDYIPDLPPPAFRGARAGEFRVSSADPMGRVDSAEEDGGVPSAVEELEVVQAEASTPEPGPAPSPEPAPLSAVAEETVSRTAPVESPVAESEPAIAKLEPSDFVPDAPEPEERRADAAAVGTNRAEGSELTDVFFDFNQDAIRPGAVPVLEKNAKLLKHAYNGSTVLIEGHCDERGTGEYNLELGKRRAQAVRAYLVDLGVDESRIQIASYGKERPFCAASTPACWQQNRRGHFVRRVLLPSSQR